MQKDSVDDNLFEVILKVGAEEALTLDMENMASYKELNRQYRPSSKLDKKIRKMISKYIPKEKSSLWKSTLKKIASFIVFVIIVCIIL